ASKCSWGSRTVGALEYLQVAHLGGLDHLVAGRCGACNADALVDEINGLVGPEDGVEDLAGDLVLPGEERGERRREHSRAADKKLHPEGLALVGGDRPKLARFVVAGGSHARLELDVLAKIEAIGHESDSARSRAGQESAHSISTRCSAPGRTSAGKRVTANRPRYALARLSPAPAASGLPFTRRRSPVGSR